MNNETVEKVKASSFTARVHITNNTWLNRWKYWYLKTESIVIIPSFTFRDSNECFLNLNHNRKIFQCFETFNLQRWINTLWNKKALK